MKDTKYGTGTIDRYRDKWRVRIPMGKNDRKFIGLFDSREHAEKALNIALKQRETLPFLSGITFYEFGERWIEKKAATGIQTARELRSRWRAIVADAPFANVPLESIMRPEIEDWILETLPRKSSKRAILKDGRYTIVETGRPMSHQSIKHVLNAINGCLEYAVQQSHLSFNPARGIRLPTEQETKKKWDWLRAYEVDAVMKLPLSLEQRTVYTVTIYQGLRQGEIAALQWADVDLETEMMTVRYSWNKRKADGTFKGTKSGKSRIIPILQPALEALLGWQQFQRDKGIVSEFVFPNQAGQMYSVGYCWGWDYKRNDGDVPTRAGIKRKIRFHDLRHTTGSNLVSGNWGHPWRLEDLKEFLGHSDIKMTQRYAHLAPDALKRLASITAIKTGNKLGTDTQSKSRKYAN